MIEHTTRESFVRHLDSSFSLVAEDVESVEFVLVEAADKTPAGVEGEQFSLIFRGPREPALPQRIYALEHPEMGRIELFLVPVGEEESGRLYEAYFNRMNRSKE